LAGDKARRVVYYVASSLDGYIAGPGESLDWLGGVDDGGGGDYGHREFYDSIDTVIMGRRSWEIARAFEASPYADKRRVVFSRSKVSGDAEWSDDPVGTTRRLVRDPGRNIWLMGGGIIAGLLASEGLLDEMIDTVHPVILGSGVPLFAGVTRRIDMRLITSRTWKNGLWQGTYAVEV